MNRFLNVVAALAVSVVLGAAAQAASPAPSPKPGKPARIAAAYVSAFERLCVQARDEQATHAAAQAIGDGRTDRYDVANLLPVKLRLDGKAALLSVPYNSCLLEFVHDPEATAAAFDAMAATLPGAQATEPTPWLGGIFRELHWQPPGFSFRDRLTLVHLGGGSMRLEREAGEAVPFSTPDVPGEASPENRQPAEDTAGRRLSMPRFPASALRNCAFGTVRLRVTIDSQGRILLVNVYNTSGNADLDEAAANAARHWRFNPGWKGGQRIGGDVIVPVAFQDPC